MNKNKPIDSSYWDRIAHRWDKSGTPLKPTREDINIYTSASTKWIVSHGTPNVLILGVTPEFYHLPFPPGTNILAADHSRAMIDNVWPGPKKSVLFSNWLSIKLPERSQNIVFTDGGLTFFSYPDDLTKIIELLHKVLSDNGLFIFRQYAPKTPQEKPDQVINDLYAGKIKNINILKLRLLMALSDNASYSIDLQTAWEYILSKIHSFEELAKKIGWLIDPLLTLKSYEGLKETHYFPPTNKIIGFFCDNPGGFMLKHYEIPSYEMGDCCPIIVFERIKS